MHVHVWLQEFGAAFMYRCICSVVSWPIIGYCAEYRLSPEIPRTASCWGSVVLALLYIQIAGEVNLLV